MTEVDIMPQSELGIKCRARVCGCLGLRLELGKEKKGEIYSFAGVGEPTPD